MAYTPIRNKQTSRVAESRTTSENGSSNAIFSKDASPSTRATSFDDDAVTPAKFIPRRPTRGAAMAATLNIKSQSTPINLTESEDSSSDGDIESIGAAKEIENDSDAEPDSPLVLKQSNGSAKITKTHTPSKNKGKGKERAKTPPSSSSDESGSVFEKDGESSDADSDGSAHIDIQGNASDESDVVISPIRKRAKNLASAAVKRIDRSTTAKQFEHALDDSEESEQSDGEVDDVTMEEAVASVTKKINKGKGKAKIEADSQSSRASSAVPKIKKGKKMSPSKLKIQDTDAESELTAQSSASSESSDGSDDSGASDNEDVPRKPKKKKAKKSKYTAEGIRRSMSPGENAEEKKERRARERAFKKSRGGRLNHYEKTQIALEKHHPELVGVWENLESEVSIVAPVKADQPLGITMSLLPFQLEGLYWMKQQEQGPWKGGMLADEMGMGKTIQTISLICSDHDSAATGSARKMTLVVAPTVAIVQWRNEFKKFTNGFKVEVWHGGNRSSDVKKIQQNDVILTSYAVLESVFRRQTTGFMKNKVKQTEDSLLHKIKWHRIILDEAHNIKDRLSNTAKAAFQLRAKFRWCLSGTPLQNRVGELYSLIRFLGVLPFAASFCKKCPCTSLHWSFKDRRHCTDCGHTPMQHVWFWNNEILKPIQRYGHVDAGGRAFKKLHSLLDRMMLRRTKVQRADDLSLPPRTVTVRRDYFTEEEEELYTSLYSDVKRNFETYLDAGTVLNNYGNIFTLITRMRQMACHPDLVLKSRTAKSIQALLNSNEDDEFTLHTCRICLDEAEDAIMSKCRHIYCRECIRSVVEGTGEDNSPECPVCHVRLIINLDQPAIENLPKSSDKGGANQGMLDRIDPTKWRSSTKIEALVEELTILRQEDTTAKSLVFSQSTSFLDLIARRLQLSGFKIARLQGTMSPEARDRTVNYFMNNNDVTVFILSIKAGGVALNLTEANHVFICDPWWNPSVEYQAMDRIHRIGQSRPVYAKRLIIENSIESRILELQKKKESMIDAALGNQDALGRLTPNDLKFLFSL